MFTEVPKTQNPKTTLRVSDSLEGLTDLSTLVIFTYYRERIQVKITKCQRCMGWGPRESRHRLLAAPHPNRGVVWTAPSSPSHDV